VPERQVPVYAAWENGWTPKPCPVCGGVTTAHAALYDKEPPEPPNPDERKPIGEAYQHAEREDCVRPPELAAAMRSLRRTE
jgi:hypothetical protein